MKKLSWLYFFFFMISSNVEAGPLWGDLSMIPCEKSAKTQAELKKESEAILQSSLATAKLYELKENETFVDITQKVIEHENTSDEVKAALLAKKRRIFLFSYPSDNLKIKGYLSIPTDRVCAPLLIVLRGGNREFGLPHPRELSIQEGYALVTTTYRGGVSEGKDEFGGKDVNDVKNLVDFLPQLEKKAKFTFDKKYMIGLSRGGMELFLALGCYPDLQEKIAKVVSLSGLLDLEEAIENRADFKEMLESDFGLPKNGKKEAWIAKRNPINMIPKLHANLPILIAQGTSDTRVCLKEGYHFIEKLHAKGHLVTYIEIEGGDHVLSNVPEITPMILEWLKKS